MMTTMEADGKQPISPATFESALDVLAQLIGHGQSIITSKTTDDSPHEIPVDQWRERVQRWVELRRNLEPDDNEAIQAVLEDEGPTLRAIRDSIDE